MKVGNMSQKYIYSPLSLLLLWGWSKSLKHGRWSEVGDDLIGFRSFESVSVFYLYIKQVRRLEEDILYIMMVDGKNADGSSGIIVRCIQN